MEQEDLSTFKPSPKMQFCEHRKARVLQYFSSVLLNGNPLQHAHCSTKILEFQDFKKAHIAHMWFQKIPGMVKPDHTRNI